MKKTLAVFCDGTGQHQRQVHLTNVAQLYNLAKNASSTQLAFYTSGVGTDWHLLTGRALGTGIAKRVGACYEFLATNYEEGDDIFMFGFSRGATVVRMLCGLIQGFGLQGPGKFRSLYGEFQTNIWQIFHYPVRGGTVFGGQPVPIRFLGVWDTVGALSDAVRAIPLLKLRYIPGCGHHFPHNRLLMSVQNARQAVAIDENRYVFGVTFFDQSSPESRHQTLQQVWFAGYHSDVGGGSADDSLAKIPLRWLAEEALQFGLKLSHPLVDAGDPNGPMHPATGLGRLYPKRERFHSERWGKPLVHASVLARTRGANNRRDAEYAPWVLWNGDYKVVPCEWLRL